MNEIEILLKTPTILHICAPKNLTSTQVCCVANKAEPRDGDGWLATTPATVCDDQPKARQHWILVNG